MPTPRMRPELKLLTGGGEKLARETSTPRPAAREPEPAPWFTVQQRQIWDETTAELRDMGLLSAADRQTIIIYVSLVEHYERAIVKLNDHPSYVVETEHSQIVGPALKAVDMLAYRVVFTGRSLGLNPLARTSMYGRTQAKPDTEADHVKDLYA